MKNNRVYAAYHANSRTLSDSASVQFVAKAAYPDLFKDLDPQQTYLNFYKNYLPVTPKVRFIFSLKLNKENTNQ